MAIDLNRQRLFFRPGLRHVLNAWLADVTDQHERQRVWVWPAKFVNTRASARFWNRPGSAGLLNCDRVACGRIGTPDLCLWLSSHHVKCAVGVNCPDGTERVCPRASKRGWARGCRRRAGTNECNQSACENNSKRVL